MEKEFSVRYQKLIGSPVFPPGVFSGSAIFERFDEKTRSHRGQLFALLLLSGPKDFDALLASKIIFDCLEEEYFRDSEGSPLAALERATVSANHRFIDLTLGSPGLSGSTEFDLVLAVSWGQVLYLSKAGAAAVYFLRGGLVKAISIGEETRVSSASGLVSAGDVLILATPKFKKLFAPDQLLTLLPNLEEEVAKVPDRHLVSALILKFEIEELPSAEELIRFAKEKKESPLRLSSLRRFLASLKEFSVRFFPFFSRLKPRRSLFLKERSKTLRAGHRLGLRTFLVLLLISFTVSVVLTVRKQSHQRLTVESQRLLSEAEEKIMTAADLVDLNNSRAQTLVNEALANLQKAERFGYRSDLGRSLTGRARELLTRITKEKIVKAELLYDFSLQKKATLSSLAYAKVSSESAEFLFAADYSGSLYRLNLTGGKVSIEKIDNGKIKTPRRLSTSGDKLLGFDKESGPFAVNLRDLSVRKNLVDSPSWSDIVDFASFSGNLYFLRKGGEGISRSLALEDGKYSKLSPWLKEGRDFSAAKSFAIDGSIYVLDSAGQISKFESGKPVDFSLTGFEATLSPALSFYTDGASNSLYLFDGRSYALFVFGKDGLYQRRYSLDEGSRKGLPQEPPIFVVAEGAQRVYFLAGSKLFRFDLE